MKKLFSFKTFLTEAKEVIDLRHKDFRGLPGLNPEFNKHNYIEPKNGFYWSYYKAVLILASCENFNISLILHNAEKNNEIPKEVKGIKSSESHKVQIAWNQLGGLVDLKTKTINISKEFAGSGQRQRILSDIKEFKQALQSLMKHGVNETFTITGAPPHIPKTVRKALELQDHLNVLLSPTEKLILYHGTSAARWEIIKNKGLRPRAQDIDRKFQDNVYVDLVPNYSENNIYLATTKKTAQFYAKRQAKFDESDPVVLQIEVPDNVKLIPDDRFVNRETGSYDVESIKKSIATMGELAYKGIILPKFIKKL